jgi:hypothetical protein
MGMLIVFEAYLAPGAKKEELLSEEVIAETMAQVLTEDEARNVGFAGIAPDPQGRERCFIAVAERDKRFIERRLEASRECVGFQIHEVETSG